MKLISAEKHIRPQLALNAPAIVSQGRAGAYREAPLPANHVKFGLNGA